jgi:hypothetical protein
VARKIRGGGGGARAGARRGGAGRGGARAAAQRGCCGTRARSGAITEGGGALVRTVEGGEQSILEIRTTVPSRPIKAGRGEIGVPSPPTRALVLVVVGTFFFCFLFFYTPKKKPRRTCDKAILRQTFVF